MKKNSLNKIKEVLEEKKQVIEAELESFATKDKKLEHDWDTKFPASQGAAGGQTLEDAADQVEDYSNMLPVEFSLETQLKDISYALDKIKKGEYGKCEKCEKEISQRRLAVCPEARTCTKCKDKL